MAIIYLFGDSITYGAWDVANSGWATLLRRHLDEKQEKDPNLYYLTYNLGIPGETTSGLLDRFKSEFEAREREDRGEENIFVFAFGANDSVFIPSKGVYAIVPDLFKSNYQSVLDIAKGSSRKIIMLNITPVDEKVCIERYATKDKIRLNSNVAKYNGLIQEIAARNQIPLVDVHSSYMASDYRKLLSEDGLHPNSEGHRAIFELIKQKF